MSSAIVDVFVLRLSIAAALLSFVLARSEGAPPPLLQATSWSINDDSKNAPSAIETVDAPRYAAYAPSLRLLTFNSNTNSESSPIMQELAQDKQRALSALKIHDQLFEEPPRDGKVRVRMYFHRASLPATLAGELDASGWGVEYGFDARAPNDGHFARGYSVERRQVHSISQS